MKWTVIFFIHESTDARNYEKDLLDELESLPNLQNVNIILIHDRINNKGVFQLEFNNATQKYNRVKKPPSLGDMRDGKEWEQVLKKIVTDFEADRYMLFTWGHGQTYGIAQQQALFNNKAQRPIELIRNAESKYNEYRVSEYLLTLSFQKTPIRTVIEVDKIKKFIQRSRLIDILWMSELNTAITKAFQGKKLDVLIMMNCNMQALENGFDLRNTVRLFIAPETDMVFDGYPYTMIFKKLNSDPGITIPILASFIKTEYVNKYAGNLSLLNDTTFFANTLDEYQNLFDELEIFFKLLAKAISSRSVNLEKLREKSIRDLQLSTFVDTQHALEKISKASKNQSLIASYDKITAISRKITSEEFFFIGSDHKKSYPRGYLFLFPDNDISTDTEIATIIYFMEKCPSEFISTSTWTSIVKKYLDEL